MRPPTRSMTVDGHMSLPWKMFLCGMSRRANRCVLSHSHFISINNAKLAMWHETGHRAEVTCILRSPQKDLFAVGYADGSIRLWDHSENSVVATFNGHKKAVTALAFDEKGTRLASGSQDTDLIVWDVVAEAGLFRYAILYISMSPADVPPI